MFLPVAEKLHILLFLTQSFPKMVQNIQGFDKSC